MNLHKNLLATIVTALAVSGVAQACQNACVLFHNTTGKATSDQIYATINNANAVTKRGGSAHQLHYNAINAILIGKGTTGPKYNGLLSNELAALFADNAASIDQNYLQQVINRLKRVNFPTVSALQAQLNARVAAATRAAAAAPAAAHAERKRAEESPAPRPAASAAGAHAASAASGLPHSAAGGHAPSAVGVVANDDAEIDEYIDTLAAMKLSAALAPSAAGAAGFDQAEEAANSFESRDFANRNAARAAAAAHHSSNSAAADRKANDEAARAAADLNMGLDEAPGGEAMAAQPATPTHVKSASRTAMRSASDAVAAAAPASAYSAAPMSLPRIAPAWSAESSAAVPVMAPSAMAHNPYPLFAPVAFSAAPNSAAPVPVAPAAGPAASAHHVHKGRETAGAAAASNGHHASAANAAAAASMARRHGPVSVLPVDHVRATAGRARGGFRGRGRGRGAASASHGRSSSPAAGIN